MTHKRETNNADRLEYPRADKRESFARITLEFGFDGRTLNDDGSDDNDHADEGEA